MQDQGVEQLVPNVNVGTIDTDGLKRALSTPIHEMINSAQGYLIKNANLATGGSSVSTPKSSNSTGQEWRRLPLNVVMKISSVHEHALELQRVLSSKRPEQMTEEEKEDASWQCNGVELFFGGCKSG